VSNRHIVIIAAHGDNLEIGSAGGLPWHRPDDLRRFRAATLGHTVIMGRLTFEAIRRRLGGPLPHRENIVLSRGGFIHPGIVLAESFAEAVCAASLPDPIFVIGGGQVYREALPHARELHLTHVPGNFPSADAFLPSWPPDEWRLAEPEPTAADDDPGASTFRIFRRV
jgi:dihydrofolate reductase